MCQIHEMYKEWYFIYQNCEILRFRWCQFYLLAIERNIFTVRVHACSLDQNSGPDVRYIRHSCTEFWPEPCVWWSKTQNSQEHHPEALSMLNYKTRAFQRYPNLALWNFVRFDFSTWDSPYTIRLQSFIGLLTSKPENGVLEGPDFERFWLSWSTFPDPGSIAILNLQIPIFSLIPISMHFDEKNFSLIMEVDLWRHHLMTSQGGVYKKGTRRILKLWGPN